MAELLCSSFFKKKIWGHKSSSWGHWYPCFGLLVTSAMGFKARMDPLHAFVLVWSSDSPLVQNVLTVNRSAWRLSLFDQCTYRCIHKHWYRFGPYQGSNPRLFVPHAAGSVLFFVFFSQSSVPWFFYERNNWWFQYL